jgi:outer membrane protein assembly factor BamB/predicted phosphohydrolase
MKIASFFLIICTIFLSCQEQKPIRFILFSDTHLAANTTGAEDLRLAVADVNMLSENDFVLISGDITDMNVGSYLDSAKQILDNLHAPYYIIPGNHDTKWSGSAGANFRALWGDDKFSFTFAGYKFIGFHQGPVLRMDDGHIPREVLTWLENELKKTGPDQPVILVMHYPLNSSIDNWIECVNIIKDYNIKAIIHGHGHRNRLRYYQGIPGLMGRSTLRAREDRGGYTLFTIRNDSVFAQERTTGGPYGDIWAATPLAQDSVQSVPDSLQPTYEINDRFPEVQLSWLFQSGNMMTASPTFDGSTLFVGDVSGTIYAMSQKEGTVLWNFKASGAIYGTAAVYNNSLVFTAADSMIYCIDSETGVEKWKVSTGNALVSVPAIRDEIVYVGASDGIFRALDLRHGEIIWEFPHIGSFVETKPLLYDNKVIFGAWDGNLYALNMETGELEWKWNTGKLSPLYSPAACWPVAADGKIFVATPDRYLSAIRAGDGKTVWRDNHWKFRETVGISQDDQIVFGRSMTDSVVAYSADTNQPNVVWASDFKYGYDIAPSMPMEKNGTLFWGTKNGLITAADAQSGQLKWQYKFENFLINTVMPISADQVLFSNIDGNVGLLTARDAKNTE